MILMRRKCCTLRDEKPCNSGQPGSNFRGVIFTFPSGKNKNRQRQRKQWLNKTSNYIDSETSTQYIRICNKHWPPNNDFEIVQGGVDQSVHPCMEFGNIPSTFSQQPSSTTTRYTLGQGITAEKKRKSSEAATKDASRINSREALAICCSSLDLIFTSNDTFIRLYKLSDSFPSDVLFSIQINSSFNVKAFYCSKLISLYPVLSGSFLQKLTLFSQITKIVSTFESSDADFWSELKSCE